MGWLLGRFLPNNPGDRPQHRRELQAKVLQDPRAFPGSPGLLHCFFWFEPGARGGLAAVPVLRGWNRVWQLLHLHGRKRRCVLRLCSPSHPSAKPKRVALSGNFTSCTHEDAFHLLLFLWALILPDNQWAALPKLPWASRPWASARIGSGAQGYSLEPSG